MNIFYIFSNSCEALKRTYEVGSTSDSLHFMCEYNEHLNVFPETKDLLRMSLLKLGKLVNLLWGRSLCSSKYLD